MVLTWKREKILIDIKPYIKKAFNSAKRKSMIELKEAAIKSSDIALDLSNQTKKKSSKNLKKGKKGEKGTPEKLPYTPEHDVVKLMLHDTEIPIHDNHLEIIDAGKKYYKRSFYISKMPTSGYFARAFEPVISFKNINTSIYVEPLSSKKAIVSTDNDLNALSVELDEALKREEKNVARRLRTRIENVTFFQQMIESRQNKKYNVAFIFTLTEESLEELNRVSERFVFVASEASIELVSFLGKQPEANRLNKPFNGLDLRKTFGKEISMTTHEIDLFSLASIFPHTTSEFYHTNGVVIGRNTLTKGHPIAFDPGDPSHNNENIVIAGKTGYGKSSLVKKMINLLVKFKNRKFVILDVENIKGRGEFCDLTDELDGLTLDLTSDTFNVFHIKDTTEYNRILRKEVRVFELLEQIPYMLNNVISLISDENETISVLKRRIVKDSIIELFDEMQIYDKQPDSLYTVGNTLVNGAIVNEKVMKKLPTLSDMLIKIVKKKLHNKEQAYHIEYLELIAALSEVVKEVHICENGCGKVYSSEEVNLNTRCSCGNEIVTHRGTFNYFDGQTSVKNVFDWDRYSIVNFDISNVPPIYLDKAMMIMLNFITEECAKANSLDPKKARKIVFVNDEQHKTFKKKANRENLIASIRVFRKRMMGVWSLTQALTDYLLYDEAQIILTQSDTKFILKHEGTNEKFLREALKDANEGDVEFILNAERGEVLLIDTKNKARFQVDILPKEFEVLNTNLELEKERLNEAS